ncbi:hypothetical protein ACQ4PT_055083 [Festuca glaucescens]
MSFAAVQSKRGRSWIVGVGGDTTIYYDPTHEDRQFQQGPRPMSAKREPVLISHGRKLYSFSRGTGWTPTPTTSHGLSTLAWGRMALVPPSGWICPRRLSPPSSSPHGSTSTPLRSVSWPTPPSAPTSCCPWSRGELLLSMCAM